MGLRSSGDPGFAVPASLLGAPTISLPVMTVSGMPLGLQIIGFESDDAALFGVSAWIAELLKPPGG
jgi:Asp-tRNA(Asn)/Glu-tRNA(Gln) amidotransferase A subunit family amidase